MYLGKRGPPPKRGSSSLALAPHWRRFLRAQGLLQSGMVDPNKALARAGASCGDPAVVVPGPSGRFERDLHDPAGAAGAGGAGPSCGDMQEQEGTRRRPRYVRCELPADRKFSE